MKKLIGFFTIILLANSCSVAQNGAANRGNLVESKKAAHNFQLLQTIPIESIYLSVDNLQNLYVATTKGQVLKYTKDGKQQFDYNNNRLGAIGKIDVRNPLSILVYYPDLAVVVILDRTLSVIQELNLLDLGIIDPKGVTIANDNNIWIFDQVAAVLKKIDQQGKTLFESRNLNQLTHKNLNPSFLQEWNNSLYLSDEENGLFVFDLFGQLKQHFSIKGIKQFQVINGQIIYKKKNSLRAFTMDNLEEEQLLLPLPFDQIETIIINHNTVYLKDNMDTIKIYKAMN